MAEPTYSELVKRELCGLTYPLPAIQALLRAFLLNAATVKTDRGQAYWEVRTAFPFVSAFVFRHLRALYDVKEFFVAARTREIPSGERRV